MMIRELILVDDRLLAQITDASPRQIRGYLVFRLSLVKHA
jgi:hypothetical protein